MFGRAIQLKFSSAAYVEEAFENLIFFAAFSSVSGFVSTTSCWLKNVLNVDIVCARDFPNSALDAEKCLDFSIMFALLSIENRFRSTIISRWMKKNKDI